MNSVVFRRGLRAPIKTDKHEQTWSNLAQDASSTIQVPLVVGVLPSAKNTNVECEVGSRVNAIFIEMNISANVVTNPKVLHWAIAVIESGQTIIDPINYYASNRKQIIHRGMEMLPKDLSTVFKRIFVVKIPKVYRRIGEGRTITLFYKCSSTEAINNCGIAIYKEFY